MRKYVTKPVKSQLKRKRKKVLRIYNLLFHKLKLTNKGEGDIVMLETDGAGKISESL